MTNPTATPASRLIDTPVHSTATVVTHAPKATAARKPPVKRLVMLLRRGHLYLGLFLFPWAILYGVTAFLFNHPTAFSDQPTTAFGPEAVAGTPLERLPTAAEQAEEFVARLNESQRPATPYAIAGEARYGRDFAFATVKAEGQTVSVLIDVKNGGGTVRSAANAPKPEPEAAPFATAPPRAGGRDQRGEGERGGGRGRGAARGADAGPPNGVVRMIREAVPAVLERTGFPGGEVTVTSVPDIVVPIVAGGRVWNATYNPMTGAVTGTPADATPPRELSWRRFLLRLHTAHGYPSEANSRWAWAAVVDAMAFTMCFWGLTGLVMWWQIKATRRAGAAVLVLSAAAVLALGFGMHAAMTG